MKTYLMILFSLFLGLALTSCDDDNSFNVIDIGDGEEEPDEDGDDEETGSVYSITFSLESGGEFTFSVDMEDATIEGDDLPDDFEGDVIEFDPEEHEVYIAGNFGGDNEWNQPGTNSSLKLSASGETGPTTTEGEHDYKYFILPPDVTNDDGENASWDYGEWESGANRSVEVAADGSVENVWGNEPEEEEDPGDDGEEFVETLYAAGDFQPAGFYGEEEWNPAEGAQIGSVENGVWDGYVYFADEGANFKLVQGDNWEAGDYGGTDGELTEGGEDIVAEEDGFTRVYVDATEMTYTLTPTVWGIVGDATPGGWDASTEMTYDPENRVWTITEDLEAGEMKFRANDAWDINYGSDEADGTLQFGGENIPIEEAGNYTITLDLDGTEFTYEVTAN